MHSHFFAASITESQNTRRSARLLVGRQHSWGVARGEAELALRCLATTSSAGGRKQRLNAQNGRELLPASAPAHDEVAGELKAAEDFAGRPSHQTKLG